MVTVVTAAGLDLLNIYMPDIVLNILLKLPALILTVSIWGKYYVLIPKMSKLRFKEVKKLTQSVEAGIWPLFWITLDFRNWSTDLTLLLLN